MCGKLEHVQTQHGTCFVFHNYLGTLLCGQGRDQITHVHILLFSLLYNLEHMHFLLANAHSNTFCKTCRVSKAALTIIVRFSLYPQVYMFTHGAPDNKETKHNHHITWVDHKKNKQHAYNMVWHFSGVQQCCPSHICQVQMCFVFWKCDTEMLKF